MSSNHLEDFLTETVVTYRKEFGKLEPEVQNLIRDGASKASLLEPCQIEVLDFGPDHAAVWLLIHGNDYPDMTFKIKKNVVDFGKSEFIRKVEGNEVVLLLINDKKMLATRFFWIVSGTHINAIDRNATPVEVAKILVRDAQREALEYAKSKQITLISNTATGLENEIKSKVQNVDSRKELLANTKKIEGALQEIKRIDGEVGSVRQLVGATKEIQDWRLLISDVTTLKEEHVPKGEFKTEVDRLDERIDALNTRIDDLREVKFARARTLLEIVLGIMAATSTIIAALFALHII